MRVTFEVLDSLYSAPRHAATQDPQGPARMPPASRGPPPLGDPDRRVGVGVRAQHRHPAHIITGTVNCTSTRAEGPSDDDRS